MLRSTLRAGFCVAALLLAACKDDPSKPETWAKMFQDTQRTKDREKLVTELRSSPHLNESFLPMLHAHLGKEKSAQVKLVVARILAQQKSPTSIEPLADALVLGESDAAHNQMNKEIAAALGAIGDRKAVPTLLKLLKARDNYVKIEAITALGQLRAPEAVEPLIELSTSETGEPFIAKKAIQALGAIGDARAVPSLRQMMFKERRGVSFYVESSFALYQIGAPAVPALVPVMAGEDKAFLDWTRENNVIEPAVYAKVAQVLGDLHAEAREAEKALLKQLKYDNGFVEGKLVRMKAAEALGRMRSRAAVPVLTTMLDEQEPATRAEYIRALVRIGDAAAVPALVKAAQKGAWDSREAVIVGISMLGGEAELAALEKLAKDEAAIHAAYCKLDDLYQACKDPAASVKKHTEAIAKQGRRLEAAKACKKDFACWVKKLDDEDAGVRERAAFELGRSGQPAYTAELVRRLSDNNLDTRYAAITAADWLVTDSKDAFGLAKAKLGEIEKQLEDERGKTQYVKVNEDLKRLAVKLGRQ
jgi:HEAT repeat protein